MENGGSNASSLQNCRLQEGAKEQKKTEPEEPKLMKLTWANRRFPFSIIFYCFQLSSSQIYICPCFIFFKA